MVEGDASSIEAFFDLFESLPSGEMLEVEVEGIGTLVPGSIVGFEVEVEAEDDADGGDDDD